jgi:KDO2-lipid IV(A) lauroyltransferase
VARAVPQALVAPVALGSGLVAARAMPGRRHMVARHLTRVMGDGLSGAELRRAVDASFQSYARFWVESFRLPGMDLSDVEARFSAEGFEHVQAGVAGGRGTILALPHLGNWDLAGRWVAGRGIRVTAVVERLEPPELFEWFVAARSRFGLDVIALGPAAGPAVTRALRENHAVALACDRDVGGAGVEVEFFGERTTLPAGPATLGLRTGAPILPLAVYERGEGRYHAVIRPPVPARREGTVREDVMRVTQAVTRELESLIRAAPRQWHLLQPNWPSDRRAERGTTLRSCAWPWSPPTA